MSAFEHYHVSSLWDFGFTGKNVKVAIFDTSIISTNFNITKRYQYSRNSLQSAKHGTFVASIIASKNPNCYGIAPDTDLYVHEIFSKDYVSLTSDYLDGFNEVLKEKIKIVNLSIGGPDYLDYPFLEKIDQMVSNDVIIVSAIGNDGPIPGSIHSPADLLQVIGVGSFNSDLTIPSYSSKGPLIQFNSIGTAKPDLLALGTVKGLNINGDCEIMSGTSMATPIITSFISILYNSISNPNIASVKQILYNSSDRLSNYSIFEQGAGIFNIEKAMKFVSSSFNPYVSIWPSSLNFTDCPYFGSFCDPIFPDSIPLIFNSTILNSSSRVSWIIEEPKVFYEIGNESFLSFEFAKSSIIWPYVGYFATKFIPHNHFKLPITGKIEVTIQNGNLAGDKNVVLIPFCVKISQTPSKDLRILFDEFHSLQFPIDYFPVDSLNSENNLPFDWFGDSLHSNFKELKDYFDGKYYFESLLRSSAADVNLNNYAIYIIVDPEKEILENEVKIIRKAVFNGMHLIVFADWFNQELISKSQLYDKQSQRYWFPKSGGSDILSLNRLLSEFGILFSDQVYSGLIPFGNKNFKFSYGNSISRFPKEGFVYSLELTNELDNQNYEVSIFGTIQVGKGMVSVFGDSNCLDSRYNLDSNCYGLLDILFDSVNVKDIIENIPWNMGQHWQDKDGPPVVSVKEKTTKSAPKLTFSDTSIIDDLDNLRFCFFYYQYLILLLSIFFILAFFKKFIQ